MFYKGKKVNFNTVLSYLNNQVSVEERDGFFVFLKQNKEAVDDDAVFGALLFLEKNNWNIELLKNKIVDLNTSFKNPYKENTFKRISILKYAAAVVLVFGVSYFIFEKNKSNNDIYEPYDTGIPNFLSDNQRIEKWGFFVEAYRDENYSDALKELHTLMDNDVNNDTSYYYSGVVAYKLEKYDAAINMFNAVLDEKTETFKYDSEYYIGISLFKNEDYDDATRALTLIAQNDQHPYKKEADKLLLLINEKQKKK